MITTRQLAELAGVSQSTVSRSLNNHPRISPATRERIRKLAEQHGYFLRAQSEETPPGSPQRTAIAVLLSDSFFKSYMDLYLDSLFNAVYGSIEEENYFPLILRDRGGDSCLDRIHHALSTGIIAGFIIINRQYNAKIDRSLTERGIPHVYMHYFGKNSLETIDIIDTNNYLGGYLATRHLLELHHEKILTVTSTGREFEDRTSGFLVAMKDAGISVNKSSVFFAEHNYDAGYQFARKNIDVIRKQTALFVQNDLGAIGSMNCLLDNGIRVPEDISVIGHDDIEVGRFCRPALTTVRQPVEVLAKTAVNRLLTLLNDPHAKLMRTSAQPSLIIRQSTGPNSCD